MNWTGFLAGLLNGLLGAGGGVVLVPMLQRKLEAKRAHATAVAIILPLCVVSAISFALQGVTVPLDLLGLLVLSGLVGAFVGSKLLCRVNNLWLTRGFGLLLIYSGARLLIGGGA